jgi:hypothetical protein
MATVKIPEKGNRGILILAFRGTIRIGEYSIKSAMREIKDLKAILDKIELPYILDDISFHNTLLELNRIKAFHGTNVWRVEKDGSLSLKNRFGHSGRYAYRHIEIMSLLEFQFVNLSILEKSEVEFIDDLFSRIESIPEALKPKKRQISNMAD